MDDPWEQHLSLTFQSRSVTQSPTDTPLLQFTGFRKRYGDFLVVAADALALERGIHLLIGPNGSGKTTLLKALAGMIAFEGAISLHELAIKDAPMQHRRLVNYCEAEPVYPPYLSGEYLTDLYCRVKQGTQAQVSQIRERLGIGDYLGQKVGTYSSGMKKKLALMLALLGQPRLILLDEPLTTFDPQAQPQLVALIREYTASGVSFILSSHQPLGLAHLEIRSSLLIRERQIQAVSSAELDQWMGVEENTES